MKNHATPKKSARIMRTDKGKAMSAKHKTAANVLLSGKKEQITSFNFEIITPAMQMAERNNVYRFFAL